MYKLIIAEEDFKRWDLSNIYSHQNTPKLNDLGPVSEDKKWDVLIYLKDTFKTQLQKFMRQVYHLIFKDSDGFFDRLCLLVIQMISLFC